MYSQRAVGLQRRRWESNPLGPHLQPVAVPSGSSVVCQRPRQESNLVYDLRKVVCGPAHSEDISSVAR